MHAHTRTLALVLPGTGDVYVIHKSALPRECRWKLHHPAATWQQICPMVYFYLASFLTCLFLFLTSLVIIVNDSSGMLSFPITRIYKHWTFMWMGISTIIILASRKHESLHASRHHYSNDLLMVLIHSESVLRGPCQGLKCGVSQTTPGQSPAPGAAGAGPVGPAEQGLHPMSCTPHSAPRCDYGKPQQRCSQEPSFKAQAKPSFLAIRAKLSLGAGTPLIAQYRIFITFTDGEQRID